MPKARRSEAEIAALVTGYEGSGLTRQEYCQREGIGLATLDYYRQQRPKAGRRGLIRVRLAAPKKTSVLALVLVNGRRIEVSGEVVEAELARLVRVAEQA